tara:strand:+ start:4288 stop:4689 length:402 start_codon:yes stop_codon:yes gene_type:complete
MPEKRFSLEEANRSLVYVKHIVKDVVHTFEQVLKLRPKIQYAKNLEHTEAYQNEYTERMADLACYVEELRKASIELKDFELGAVSFPGIHNEGNVNWYWEYGQHCVEFWYPVDKTTRDKIPIKELETCLAPSH